MGPPLWAMFTGRLWSAASMDADADVALLKVAIVKGGLSPLVEVAGWQLVYYVFSRPVASHGPSLGDVPGCPEVLSLWTRPWAGQMFVAVDEPRASHIDLCPACDSVVRLRSFIHQQRALPLSGGLHGPPLRATAREGGAALPQVDLRHDHRGRWSPLPVLRCGTVLTRAPSRSWSPTQTTSRDCLCSATGQSLPAGGC